MPQSLQCPRCNGSVRVTDQAAGRRVKCPHCQQTFLAPGIDRSGEKQDDDWLSLEEPATPTAASPRTAGSEAPNSNLKVSKAPRSNSSGSKKPSIQPPLKLPPDQDILGEDLFENAPVFSNSADASFPDLSGEAIDSEEEEFVLKLPEKATLKTPSKTSKPTTLGAGFLQDEEAILKEYAGDDFDDFTSESEPLPSTMRSSRAKGVHAQPGATGQGKHSNPTASPKRNQTDSTKTAQPIEYASEYRVTCKVCGSFIYAKATQAGKTIKCSDCYSEILIPSPPRIKKKTVVDMDQVETFQFESSPKAEKRPDPFQKSADQLLAEAEQAEEDSPSKPSDFDTPKVGEWIAGVLAPFRDPSVLVHLAGLCILGIIPALIVIKMDMTILTLGLFPGGLILGLLSVSCGMAILMATANDEPQVSEWPTLDPFNWIGQLTLVGAAAIMAALPVWALSTLILGPHLLATAMTMFSIYLLFPFILLSMLDMNSITKPFSSELARSVTKCEEAWGGFYFSSGLLFVGTFLVFSLGSTASAEACTVMSIIAAETTAFLYFGMIGRLAYAIGQTVNAPPRNDEVDRTRRDPTE